MEVQGPRERIELLLVTLKKGPPLAQVDQLHVNWLNAQGESDGFRIIAPW
jgi:acylphosphatase